MPASQAFSRVARTLPATIHQRYKREEARAVSSPCLLGCTVRFAGLTPAAQILTPDYSSMGSEDPTEGAYNCTKSQGDVHETTAMGSWHHFKIERDDAADTTGLDTSSSAQLHTGSHVDEQSNDVSDADSHIENSPQPANSMEQDIPDAREPSSGTPIRDPQVTSTPAAEREPQGHSGGSSAEKAMEKSAAGNVRQATDAAKVGSLKDISDLLQGFTEMCIMEGTVKKEYEALQQRLQAMLKTLDKHSEVDNPPVVMSKITEIRE
ncbi:hypothetical protein FRC11_015023 [Ceratobasidium sp. 423]|nr:hypothetical protein FRC11_015023 [Ceratobasidium sp. 423]